MLDIRYILINIFKILKVSYKCLTFFIPAIVPNKNHYKNSIKEFKYK